MVCGRRPRSNAGPNARVASNFLRRYRAHLRPADFAKVFTAEGSFGDARKSEDAKVAELRASIASLGDDDDAAAKGDVVEKHGAGIDLLGYDADAGKHVAPALPSHYV